MLVATLFRFRFLLVSHLPPVIIRNKSILWAYRAMAANQQHETAVKRLARRVSNAIGVPNAAKAPPSLMAASEGPSELVSARRFDSCGEHAAIKVSLGLALGAVGALLLFKGRGMRAAMIGFGAGCGAGSSFTACRLSFPSSSPGISGNRSQPKKEKEGADEPERLHTASAGALEIVRDVDTKPRRKINPPHGKP